MPPYVAVAATFADALTIIDISNPAAPAFVGSIWGADAPNWLDAAYDVYVKRVGANVYAFVIAALNEALSSFNVSNPALPVHLSTIRGTGAPNFLDQPSRLAVQGNYAYIAVNGLNNGLTVIDISNPAALTFVGTIQVPGSNFDGIFVRGNYAYVVEVGAGASSGLHIFDISNPAIPLNIGSIHGSGAPNWLGGAHDVFVEGNYAYIACDNDNSLTIIDVSNPLLPTFCGSIRGAGAPNFLGRAFGVSVVGQYAYVTAFNDNALSSFNISNPLAPSHVDTISGIGAPNWLQGAWLNYVQGNYAYVAAYLDDSLTIIDISNPAALTFVGNIQGPPFSLTRARSPFWFGSAAGRGCAASGTLLLLI